MSMGQRIAQPPNSQISDPPGLPERLIAAQEEERRRIARELHDDLGQRTVLIEMQAQRLSALLPQGPAQDSLDAILDQLHSLEEGIRSLSRDLCPSPLADIDIENELRALVDNFHANGAPVRMLSRGEWPTIPREAGMTIYRIAQEALRNALRHAPGAPVYVALSLHAEDIRLTVKDHGPGFDRRTVRAKGSLGLASMFERARMAGGTLKLRTRPGEGTSLHVRVPYRKTSAPQPRVESGHLPGPSVSREVLG